jgi:acyl carrier protein
MLKAMPRTHNGKLDRKALPAPAVTDGSRRVVTAPKTATEEMVLNVFRDVLERQDFGVSDNFFDLGGHSLMAARLMAKLRTASGVDLPLRDLFARPTAAALAEAIDALQWLQRSNVPAAGAGVREEILL